VSRLLWFYEPACPNQSKRKRNPAGGVGQRHGTTLATAQQHARLAQPALVEELARPVSIGDLNARWDMCRQLFLSQLLTESEELLRTDMGWPERRHYLAQNIVGEARFAALTKGARLPEPAPTLLGYLTMLTLATIGQTDLVPAALGTWLIGQQVPASPAPSPAAKEKEAAPTGKPAVGPSSIAASAQLAVAAPVVTAAKPAAAPPAVVAAPAKPVAATVPVAVAAAPASKQKTLFSTVGALAVAGLAGSCFLLGTPANATQQEAAAAAAPKAPPVAPVKAGTVPVHTAAGAVLIDTIGNAALANQIGGGFSVALGRYPKGEGQPLNIKLISRSTLAAGINPSESLLYKYLVNSSLSRPSSVVLDRLVFGPSQAKLGAEGTQQLGNVAHLLKTFPKAHLLVLGHATTKKFEAMHLSPPGPTPPRS
jgi:outer membrane protein OmpA-like peptidoglycan-associated protein